MLKRSFRRKLAAVTAIVLSAAMLIGIMPMTLAAATIEPEAQSIQGVGQGIQWPAQVFSPWVDMVIGVSDPAYAVMGTTNLGRIMDETGIRFFNLGFIQASSWGTQIANDRVVWGWAGQPSFNPYAPNRDSWQYEGIRQSIREVRARGGDVTISMGGLAGTPIWGVQGVTEDQIFNTYMQIINAYGLTRLDLDIEHAGRVSWEGLEINRPHARAVRRVQDATGIQIVLTVPVMPFGLVGYDGQLGLGTLRAFIEAGVDITMVNIMAMCYGNWFRDIYHYGTLEAISNTARQLQWMFARYGNRQITAAEAYAMIGVTVSIGYEGWGHPYWTTAWTQLVMDYASYMGLQMVSFWSINRDALITRAGGHSDGARYDHTNVFLNFGNHVVTNPPHIMGIGNRYGPHLPGYTGVGMPGWRERALPLPVGRPQRPDGSGPIVVPTPTPAPTPTPDPGPTPEPTPTPLPTPTPDPTQPVAWAPGSVFVQGDLVVYDGRIYRAGWWTLNERPGTNPVWQFVAFVDGGGPVDSAYPAWCPNTVYWENDRVTFEGRIWRARWWTQGNRPDISAEWENLGPAS
jgi:chitinase